MNSKFKKFKIMFENVADPSFKISEFQNFVLKHVAGAFQNFKIIFENHSCGVSKFHNFKVSKCFQSEV